MASPQTMKRPRRGRRIAAVLAVLIAVVLVAGVAAVAYDNARAKTLAPGLKVGGVAVGGKTVATARAAVVHEAVRPLRRTIEVSSAGRTFTLTAGEARVKADVDGALDDALARSREGWLGARVLHGITGARVNEDVELPRSLDRKEVGRFARHVAAAVERAPVEAHVEPHASGLDIKASHAGRTLDATSLARRVRRALVDPARSERLTAKPEVVKPKTSLADLRAKYDSYIIIDRQAHQLRLYQHLRLDRTFPIAVGKAGLETPAGLYDVQWKEENPIWRVPNSDWAGALAGKNIPPGPDNPIKARWLAFDGAAGIHGIDPSEYGSIGHDASHGCVRMRIPDVIDVYAKTPVGSPVFIA